MALTDDEHQRFQTLQDEMIGLVESTETDQAAAAFGKIARVSKNVLAREAETRTNKDVGAKVKAARQAREARRNGNGTGTGTVPGRVNANSGAA